MYNKISHLKPTSWAKWPAHFLNMSCILSAMSELTVERVVGKRCPGCGGDAFYVTGEFCYAVFVNDEGNFSSVKEYEVDKAVKCRNCGREWSA